MKDNKFSLEKTWYSIAFLRPLENALVVFPLSPKAAYTIKELTSLCLLEKVQVLFNVHADNDSALPDRTILNHGTKNYLYFHVLNSYQRKKNSFKFKLLGHGYCAHENLWKLYLSNNSRFDFFFFFSIAEIL